RRAAGARVGVAIRPASGTQSTAVLAAHRTGRQREDRLLADERRQVDLVAAVEAEREVLGLELLLDLVRQRLGEHELERGREREREGLEAARAGAFGDGAAVSLEVQVVARAVVRDVHLERAREAEVVRTGVLETLVQLLDRRLEHALRGLVGDAIDP